MDFNHRNKEKSFLWTILRDPTRRIISEFFHFQVSRKKVEPTDANFKAWIATVPYLHAYYILTLSLDSKYLTDIEETAVEAANRIVQDYDFIGITERMDESIVSLQLLLGLATEDVLFMDAKSSGGFDDGAGERGCVYIVPSFVSSGMKQYFQSPAFRKLVRMDAYLYQAASRSLDLTIEKLGRSKFNEALADFRHAQQLVKESCSSTVRFPCDSTGIKHARTDCMWGDSGCGFACIDRVRSQQI